MELIILEIVKNENNPISYLLSFDADTFIC